MPQILLTGASGFLGCNLQEVLAKKYRLIAMSRKGAELNFKLEEQIPTFHQTYDIVIHAAGKAHQTPKNQVEAQQFFDVNVLGTANLLNALETPRQPKSFVFISTVAVYGLQKGNKITEDSPLNALDPYGLSKIEAEHLVQEWCKKKGVICTILRLPLIVGPNPPGNLGAMIKGIQNGYYFNIAGGNSKKSMVLASDIAKFILIAAEFGGIYNLTDGIHPTFNELSRTISLQLGRKFVPNMPLFFAKILAKIGDLIGDKFPVNSNKLAKIMAPLTFDDTKARKAFGWNPTPVLKGFKIEENA